MSAEALLPPYLKELSQRTFDADQQRPKDEYVIFKQDNLDGPMTKVAAKDNLGVITGLPKSRKSLFLDCLMSGAYTNDPDCCLEFKLLGQNILHVDCEQPTSRWFSNRKRFSYMCGYEGRNIPGFHSINLRPYTYQERIEQIDYALANLFGEVDWNYIVIDGIIQLAKEENDYQSAEEAISWLRRWSDEYGACVITVLHTNRGGESTNGKIGSLIDKACDFAFLVTKDGNKSKVSHTWARDRAVQDFYFGQNPETGMPLYSNLAF